MAFIDQGEFEAMKTLSGLEAACCDEHSFHAKIRVFEPFSSYRCLTKWSEQRKRITKMTLLLPHTFLFTVLTLIKRMQIK